MNVTVTITCVDQRDFMCVRNQLTAVDIILGGYDTDS